MHVTRATDICEGLIVDLVPSLRSSASSWNAHMTINTHQIIQYQLLLLLTSHWSLLTWVRVRVSNYQLVLLLTSHWSLLAWSYCKIIWLQSSGDMSLARLTVSKHWWNRTIHLCLQNNHVCGKYWPHWVWRTLRRVQRCRQAEAVRSHRVERTWWFYDEE